ncbi:pseudouridine synthase [Westerdykella ornata]|uniref:Pseudouridine synthase n=1 Tax=Westerdykella ornata TaxID=318751 RepID=A0A6A6JQU5_WESOR|nr:pseudouridine synthase [Westerdykella ornata]KAF2279001.1 pseudouridine synthase [Westerdykella ornata]
MEGKTKGYEGWTQERLIERIRELERRVAATSATAATPTETSTTTSIPASAALPETTPSEAPSAYTKPPKAPPKPFDFSKYSTRLIALKFAYLGQAYNGFEHHRNNTTPLPTIEEELWKALVKTRLISPVKKDENGGKEGNNGSLDYGRVGRKEYEKWDREGAGADVNWEGTEYSKCGRTDRGVSAFGQVIGIRVRSNRPLARIKKPPVEVAGEVDTQDLLEERPEEEEQEEVKEFDDLKDELPYIQLLNRVLPPDIRIFAWCPNPGADFSARFHCKERRYKYFFTNPSFAPVPGAASLYTPVSNGSPGREKMREGWLDIEAMRTACTHLVGLHDFRNFCKVDASKQITNFKRRIFHASIDEVSPLALPSFLSHPSLGNPSSSLEAPKLYAFTLHGSAFLWHQVRSIVAILFLIGQGLEYPSLVPSLLDVSSNPTRPKYEMASDAPLVLWDCIFPSPEEVQSSEEREVGYEDRLNWIYVGDPGAVEPKSRRGGIGNGKWGRGGVIDDVWEVWRARKIEETLGALLLDTIAGNGKVTLEEEARREREEMEEAERSGVKLAEVGPRVFDGADVGRAKGKYVPVLQRERQESVEVVNERYAKKKGLKEDQRRPKEEDIDE